MSWPAVDLASLTRRPVVVLAAHPDDEVLGVGGLLSLLAARDGDVSLVWATDGGASHPGARPDVVARLPLVRRAESAAAAELLGLAAARRTYLNLPDGGLAGREAELAMALAAAVPAGGLLLAPWAHDAHPDHEAAGRAARVVAAGTAGVALLEYPVWMWHWARPDDSAVPWRDARRIDLDGESTRRKAAAIACFRSQIEPAGAGPADLPVLPERVLAHFRRAFEVVFGPVGPVGR